MRNKFKVNMFIIVIIFSILISFIILVWINKKSSLILFNYGEEEIKKISTTIINKAINKQLANKMDMDDLFHIEKNSSNGIQTIDFNPYVVNKVLNTTTNVVLINLKKVEEGNVDYDLINDSLTNHEKDNLKRGIIYEIPLGIITNNAFLSNLGPRIPIKLNMIGSVTSNIKTEVKEYGINNALIEVYVKMRVTFLVNIPFTTKKVSTESDIPIAIKLVQGIVPKYYGGTLSKESNLLSIPIE